ncbi:MAG: sugar phosphorylase [Anaerolineales bacterium]|nr:sugar phosphorylase [Anaerolineales bacterium]
MSTPEQRIQTLLTFLYGPQSTEIWPKLERILENYRMQLPTQPSSPEIPWSERDAILITYADQFSARKQSPLQTLATFLETYLGDAVSGVHLLPFYPYSSDDGFSVIDYRAVNPSAGTWADLPRLDAHYRLMFDAVINHISRHSAWFERYVRGEEPFTGYFIEVAPETDLSGVTRPRALPLLTPIETARGMKHVWTTFSDDQIDLNYANPEVLLEMIDLLLFYVSMGAEIIRLDAIAYLWKEIGTACIHLPRTHAVVKLWRAVLDAIAPYVILITETNVPHAENISYFGDGEDEAQWVYQFPLAPLVLHAFQTGDAGKLSEWAATLAIPSPRTTFFNFIASHDGIGVRPAEGLLTPEEIKALAAQTLAHGGQVSYRNHPDGSRSVYELNITLFDALNDPDRLDPEMDVQRFLASQVIMLSLAGVPGIYVHSLFGSRNCGTCAEESGRARSINREKFALPELVTTFANPASPRGRVLSGYLHLLRVRSRYPAFHPNAGQMVLSVHEKVFAVRREAGGGKIVFALVNVSSETVEAVIELGGLGKNGQTRWRDRLDGGVWEAEAGTLRVVLHAYQFVWLSNDI